MAIKIVAPQIRRVAKGLRFLEIGSFEQILITKFDSFIQSRLNTIITLG